jgi:hypothetical protein
MGNNTGKLWRNPEDDLLRDRYSPDFTPAPQSRPLTNNDPLFRAPPVGDAALEARLRATNMDCVMDTASFVKYPLILGAGWGAVMASVHARPDLKQSAMLKGPQSGVVLAAKGFVRELHYLRAPVLALGSYCIVIYLFYVGGGAALYSIVSCGVAKWRQYDGVANSVVAGSTLGTVIGIYSVFLQCI